MLMSLKSAWLGRIGEENGVVHLRHTWATQAEIEAVVAGIKNTPFFVKMGSSYSITGWVGPLALELCFEPDCAYISKCCMH